MQEIWLRFMKIWETWETWDWWAPCENVIHSVQPLSSPPFLIHPPPHSWYPPQSPEMLIPPLTGTGKGQACPEFTECLEVKVLYGVHYF